MIMIVSEEEFRNEIQQHYMTSNGAIHSQRDPKELVTSGNHHVINVTYLAILKYLSWGINRSDILNFKKFVESTRDATGVFNRAETKIHDDQAHDDMLAVGVGSKLCSQFYHKEIFCLGQKWFAGLFSVDNAKILKWTFAKLKIPFVCRYYYDNTEETAELQLKNWHGRFPWLVAIYRSLNNKFLGPWSRLNLFLRLVLESRQKDDGTSGRILTFIMLSHLRSGKYWGLKWAIKKWDQHIEDRFGGFEGLFGRYHGYDHAYARVFKK